MANVAQRRSSRNNVDDFEEISDECAVVNSVNNQLEKPDPKVLNILFG